MMRLAHFVPAISREDTARGHIVRNSSVKQLASPKPQSQRIVPHKSNGLLRIMTQVERPHSL